MDLSQFQFDLPEERIALRPVEPQDSARLLVVHGDGRLEDAGVRDLPRFLSPGDVMVFNDTRVLPAARKFEDLQIAPPEKSVPEIESIEKRATLPDRDALQVYADHPAHQPVLEFIRGRATRSAAADFES